MFVKRALVMALVSIFMTTAALSQSRSRQQETIACQDDALRLCGPYIPDQAKIYSCLLTYRAYISPACRAIDTGIRNPLLTAMAPTFLSLRAMLPPERAVIAVGQSDGDERNHPC